MVAERRGPPGPTGSGEDEHPLFGRLVAVTGEELAWLRRLGAEADEFLRTYVPDAAEVTLENLDLAFRAWQTAVVPLHTPQEVIQLLGGYLGNKCIDDLNMRWVLVRDEVGEDYAVRGNTADVIMFPFSAVMKRIEAREYEFLEPIYKVIRHAVLEDPRVRRLNTAEDR